MPFGHFVHLFHYLIHSHLVICRYDLGHLHPPSRSDLPPVLSVQLLCHPFPKSARCPCVSQFESVITGHAPHFSLFLNGRPPMRFDKLCVIQALISPHLAHSVPTSSMVAGSHPAPLLLLLWDISSAARILCTMRDLEHSVSFQKHRYSMAWSTGRLLHAGHPSAGNASHPSLPAHICRDPANHCAVAHDHWRPDKHSLSIKSRLPFLCRKTKDGCSRNGAQ